MNQPITLTVQHFALFREATGKGEEVITTDAQVASDLYSELKQKYGFKLPVDLVKVSINLQFVPMSSRLKDGDRVVFIPPVAGG